jgi:hypothetical protein
MNLRRLAAMLYVLDGFLACEGAPFDGATLDRFAADLEANHAAEWRKYQRCAKRQAAALVVAA